MLSISSAQVTVTKLDKRFDDILSLSRNMLQDAGKGEWEHILDMQMERQQLINDYFATPVPEAKAEAVASGIREMLDIDRVLIERSKQAMSGLSSDMQKINKGIKAHQAYAVNM